MDREIAEQALELSKFTEEEITLLKEFYSYSVQKTDLVNERIRDVLKKDPLWGPIINAQTEEQANEDSKRSLEFQRAAIFNNNWKEYNDELLMQGRAYADLNVNYSDWQRVINLYKAEILPLIKSDFSKDIDTAFRLIHGLELLIDYAMAIIALSYFAKKNDAIREMNNQLELRVEQRTEELKEINQELESFTYTVSHDLRAPLRAISGFAKVLEDNYSNQLDDDGKKYVSIITNSAKNMGELIDDLLTLSRIGRKDMKLISFNIQALFQEIFDELIIANNDHRIDFNLKDLPKVKGDRELTKHVVKNLLENAIKYSAKKNESIIEVGCTRENDRNVIYVKDNGVGFNMKYVHKLFGIFERLHSEDEFEGTGVGLAIVHRIINKHGGRIWAESEIDKGATFYFTLNN